ncbi:hypothetical protein CK203_058647 [Vitis vinifera]|uniref:Uncharacterized protein n=1 Tax=Vitis vinifera TaxID=29760 RepID=A0A438FTH6_VITVI|nr:hypothetical protein CK203_058647 [Vitis vinifera]
MVINFVDYSLNQGAPAGHESAETPIGHESNGAVAGDRTSNQMVPLPLPLLGTNQMARCRGSNLESNGAVATAAARDESNGAVAGDGALYSDINLSRVLVIFITIVHAILNTIAEEAMNFMSYVAEVSRGWDEPNARDMGRMKSQPKAKGEMYILNDGMNMKAEIAAMERRLEELEMNQMQEAQAISQTPLQTMPCAICLSYEHLVEECPIIPTERKCLPPQYQQPAQAPQQASNLEQAMVNLCKVVGDFVGKQEAPMLEWIKEWTEWIKELIEWRAFQPQHSARERKLSSQPYQNSMSIHEMEAEEGEPSQKKEIEEVITLRSGKEVDLPTCRLEHKVESETEKEKREEIKGKKKGESIEKDDYDFDIDEEPQKIVIKEELMKKHMPPPFLQALYGKIIQTSFWMIKIKRNCKEIERKKNRSKIGAKSKSNGRERKQGRNRGKTGVCEISQPLRNRNFVAKPVRNPIALSAKIFAAAKPNLAHECHFAAQCPHFAAAKAAANHQSMKSSISQGKAPFGRVFRSCESEFGTRVPLRSTGASVSQLRNALRSALSGAQIMHMISRFKAWEVRSPQLQTLRAPVEETMPPKETTRTEAKVLIQPTQEAITDTSAPQDPTTT